MGHILTQTKFMFGLISQVGPSVKKRLAAWPAARKQGFNPHKKTPIL